MNTMNNNGKHLVDISIQSIPAYTDIHIQNYLWIVAELQTRNQENSLYIYRWDPSQEVQARSGANIDIHSYKKYKTRSV